MGYTNDMAGLESQKVGWLIVNGFLGSDKFNDIYALLTAAFRVHNMPLKCFPNTAFCTPLGLPPIPKGENTLPDFVLFWDKDVALAQRFEYLKVPVFNSAATIARCDDKAKTALALLAAGLRMPKTILGPMTFENVGYTSDDFLQQAADVLGFPFVVKACFGSFGQQVHLARNLADAKRLVQEFAHRPFLLQEFVASSCGRDLRINIVGDEAPATLLRTSSGDFRSNVTLGGSAKAYTPTSAQTDLARLAARAVNADFAGVDILFGADDEPLVCEVNSNPHFRSTLDATGVNLAEHIARHIRRALT